VTAQGTVVAEGTSPPSPKGRRALGVALAVAVLAVALDQGSKALAVAQLTSGERVPLVGDLFGLSLVYNPGAAFSLGSGSTWIFTLVGLLAAIAVVVFAVRLRGARWGAALGLVLGGAVGNLIDRVLYGHVIDFLDFYIPNSSLPHWPAFNVADMAIVGGAALFIIDELRRVGK